MPWGCIEGPSFAPGKGVRWGRRGGFRLTLSGHVAPMHPREETLPSPCCQHPEHKAARGHLHRRAVAGGGRAPPRTSLPK